MFSTVLWIWSVCQVIADKHEDVMAKFGAIMAQGIMDAGGRNVTISLQSRSGHNNMCAIIGLLIFNQFWYEYFNRRFSTFKIQY